MTRPLTFLAGVIAAAGAIWYAFGEVFVAFATLGLNSAKFWLLAAMKKLGWASIWRVLQPLSVRLATWELPKRGLLWTLSLAVGARNRRRLQRRVRASKAWLHAWKDLRYRNLEARFGRYTNALLGGVIVIASILLSVFVLGFYALWYSASFFRALMALGGWALRYALSWVKIGTFNAVVLRPLAWLQAVLPARPARALRRVVLRVARAIIRRRRSTVPRLEFPMVSARQFFSTPEKSRNGTGPSAKAG